MALRMGSPLPRRVIQVLQDRLPAELDLIDAEEADGVTTLDVPNTNYYEWDRKVIPQYPAITIEFAEIDPLLEARPDTFGQRLNAEYLIRVKIHALSDNLGDNPLRLQKSIHRYCSGIFRVLCIMKEGLQTLADPTRFVSIVRPGGAITLGPDVEQEGGIHLIRTGMVPIRIQQIEARS